MMELRGVVYILTNKDNTVLYTGVTRNLQRRIAEHRLHLNQGFTKKYNTDKLVYYELFDRLDDAIHREKQLKKWHRDWKEKIISDFNPEWRVLTEDIGVDEDILQAVKEAYEYGTYEAVE
jgi:putative endonuclease